MTTEQMLTSEERLANLTLQQPQQLVGLVEHDPARDRFPISGWDALVWTVGNAKQTALHYVLRSGAARVPSGGSGGGCHDTSHCWRRNGSESALCPPPPARPPRSSH
jgi:4-hydroxyphenylpyruvate dioxygenase